ncbi:MAG TPA: FAD-binding oxidoreductase [Methylomirabilota bacterium]|nr:FAD-binding oxidoreductase [Methylomirabilota bacterium]
MSVTARALGGALASIVGPGADESPAARAAAAVDGREPQWVVRPRTLDEAARVVALAHDEGLAVLPRGGGSALGLGAPPERADLVLDLGGLDAILEHNPDDLTATVQAGVTAGALAARLAAHRQTLPLDPPGWSRRTLGGIAATAASGPLRPRCGTMRDLLLGVRFVQADGVLTWGGARVVKSVTGYDVPKLLVGSLGTLGVLGELTLRLHPLPESEATCLVELRSVEAAQELAAGLVDSTLQPSRLELLAAGALAASGLPPAAAGIVVSFGSVEAAVRAQQAVVIGQAGRVRARVETMGPGFWRTYDRVLAGTGSTVLRVTTLTTRLAATIGEVRTALGDTPDLVVTACVPLGLLRVAVGQRSPAFLARAIEQLRAFVAADDGSVVVERGAAALRSSVDAWGPVPPPALELMRALKQEFDPRRTLNPGRFAGGI